MIKKTLEHSVKVLKISTWIGVVFSLLVVLITGFFVIFPHFLERPIERQLSQATGLNIDVSDINFKLDDNHLILNIAQLKTNSKDSDKPLVHIKNLHWQVKLDNFLEDIYHPHQLLIDTLSINPIFSQKSTVVDNQFEWQKIFDVADFFESLAIQKILIKGSQPFEIAPIIIKHYQGQLVSSVINQTINNQTFEFALRLSNEQASKKQPITLFMTINNKDFSLSSDIKLYQKNQQNYVEFSGLIEQINIADISQYLPVDVVGKKTYDWIKKGFKSGLLEQSKIHILKNISKDLPAVINFNAHLTQAELLFDNHWQTLKELDATISATDKNINIQVNHAKLYDFPINDAQVDIVNMSAVHILNKINTQSERLLQFLAQMPLAKSTHDTLKQFSLTGKLQGKLDLLIPLSGQTSIIKMDLMADNNQLSTLDGAVVVENYHTNIVFNNNQISTNGTGNIRGVEFDILVNPQTKQNDKNTPFVLELLKDDFKLHLAKQSGKIWHANINSNSLKAKLNIALTDALPKVNIASLQVNSSEGLKGQWDIQPSDLPDMFLNANNMLVDGQQIPDFSVKLASNQNVLSITDLSFKGIGVSKNDLSFDGAWVAGKTRLIARAKGKGLSEFLQKLTIKEPVSGGAFEFDLRLFCNCTPWNMSLETLSGIAQMSVKEGSFTDKDPNIGRVLSLLNIKSIAKHLKLDVADLTNKGFAYDSINAQITLQDSLAEINHFQLEASSSAISLSGQSHIIDKVYDIEAKVTPAIGDAVPIASYLAGGGLAGLGVWLLDQGLFGGKLIDAIIDKVAEFKYKITGPWDNPIIE